MLDHILMQEAAAKKHRAVENQITMSGFPFRKTIDMFDFSFQPSIDKPQIDELCTMRFFENKENVVFLGTPGVGKTHLAVALGILAAQHRYSTYYINCNVVSIKGDSYRLKERKESMKQKQQVFNTLFEQNQ